MRKLSLDPVVDLTLEDPRYESFDGLPSWQLEQALLVEPSDNWIAMTERIPEDWVQDLKLSQLKSIVEKNSLRGIALPQEWVSFWKRVIRDPFFITFEENWSEELAACTGTTFHLWRLWVNEVVRKHLTPMERELLERVHSGDLYQKVGVDMFKKYGADFLERRPGVKAAPYQRVNYFLNYVIPTKIVRAELLALCKLEWRKIENKRG